MSSKTFLFLLALAICILSFSIFGSDSVTSSSKSETSPIVGVDGSKIKKISINSGEKNVDILSLDNKWVVANRNNYQADSSKVNSLLLKLLSPQAIQSIPSSPEGLKELGLEEGAEKNGITTKISLHDSELLSGVLLGNLTSSNPENPNSTPAQYVKRLSANDVMILKNPIIAPASSESWISTELINLLGKTFYKLENYSAGNITFSVNRKNILDNSNNEMLLNVSAPEGKIVNQALVSQVASGLENLGIVDVISSSSEESTKLNFDRESKFYISNGLVYSIFTAAEEIKAEQGSDPQNKGQTKKTVYAKISVTFDSKIVDEIKALEVTNATSSSASSQPSSSSSSSSSSSELKKLEFSTTEEALKQNEIYKPWVYKLPEYAAAKFRKDLNEFFQDKPEAEAKK